MTETRTFKIAPGNISAMRAAFIAHGMPLPEGNSGTVQGPEGFQITYAYDETAQTLSVTLDGGMFKMPFAWPKLNQILSPYVSA